MQSYDPRSPTQEFERTPIVIPLNDEEIIDKKVLRIKNGDTYASPCLKNDVNDGFVVSENVIKLSPDSTVAKNLCNDFYDMSLNETLKETDEPLGSSTTSNNCIENNLSLENKEQPAKLLETNFDYVEIGNVDIFEDSEEIFAETTEKSGFELKNLPLFDILNEDPRSPSLGIERTPIVVAKAEEIVKVGNVEEMSDDILIKVLQSTNNEQQNEVKESNGLLIYEDEAIVTDTPKKAKSVGSNSTRTPLSCMKNKGDATHTRSKSANNYDPKKDLTLPIQHVKYVSHIPRLKSLSKQATMGSSISLKNISKTSAIGGDCENTPPHSHRDIWDKDSSIVL